jgi:hypothetical protein
MTFYETDIWGPGNVKINYWTRPIKLDRELTTSLSPHEEQTFL